MRLNRRQFIARASIEAGAFALPFAAKSVLGQSKRVQRMPVLSVGHGG